MADRFRIPLVLGAICLGLAGCGRAGSGEAAIDRDGTDAHAPVRFEGAPYLGSVEVVADVPGEGAGAIRDSGHGSVHFDRSPGAAATALVLGGSIKEEGDAAFFLEGVRDGPRWRSNGPEVKVIIAGDGGISGGGEVGNQALDFAGRATDGTFDLDVGVTLKSASAKGLPAGTRFLFSYRLRRDAASPAAGADAGRDGQKGQCKRFVWRIRNIADFSGGPMRMIQVPECVG